jgi:PAS domain S-box-containing protein
MRSKKPARGGALKPLSGRTEDGSPYSHGQTFVEAILDHLPLDVMVRSVADRRVALVNRHWERSLKLTRQEVVGNTLEALWPGRDTSRMTAHEDAAIASRQVETQERAIYDDQGVIERYLLVNKVVIPVDGEDYVLTATDDITALRTTELALQAAVKAADTANEAKSAFLATMSHEIRTPLNGILGMVQAMATDPMSRVQRERLEVIRHSGEALLAILNDILDLSKIEAGKLEIETIDFDLRQVVEGAYSTFTTLANKKGLSFVMDATGAQGAYRGDPVRLRQILYNLCSNALKFTADGRVEVKMDYRDGELELSVRDTGIGIDPETAAGLFDRFVQADTSTSRRFGGTGLGLAICQNLAELMGGRIGLESVPGEGSCFTLVLPLAPGDAACARAVAGGATKGDVGDLSNLRVLAAEDNGVNQLVLKTLLLQVGVIPTLVGDGAQALEAWESCDWDMILMDVQMPVMDGVAAVREIRRREAALGRPPTPVIGLTANAMSHQLAEYTAAGMNACVTKPIDAAALFRAIERLLLQDEDVAEAPALAVS